MGSRLKKLKASKPKLSDGKPIGGKGRLTDAAIYDIQNYYGLAIRRHKGDLEGMRKAVWAEYFHLGSTDDKPFHNVCDPKWCKYKQFANEGIL